MLLTKMYVLFRTLLWSVFDEVILVKELVLHCKEATTAERQYLSFTLTKLHVWTLTHYEKCVFLDSDTLVWSDDHCWLNETNVYRCTWMFFVSIVEISSASPICRCSSLWTICFLERSWARHETRRGPTFSTLVSLCSIHQIKHSLNCLTSLMKKGLSTVINNFLIFNNHWWEH